MPRGATLVRNTRQNRGHQPGGPTGPVRSGSIADSAAVMAARPPPASSVKPSRMDTPTSMIMPKITSIMVMDL